MREITIGSIVTVNFNNAQYTLCGRALVHEVPNEVNKAWYFEDLDTGLSHEVSEPCTITLLQES